jgi:hypothetical protein
MWNVRLSGTGNLTAVQGNFLRLSELQLKMLFSMNVLKGNWIYRAGGRFGRLLHLPTAGLLQEKRRKFMFGKWGNEQRKESKEQRTKDKEK